MQSSTKLKISLAVAILLSMNINSEVQAISLTSKLREDHTTTDLNSTNDANVKDDNITNANTT